MSVSTSALVHEYDGLLLDLDGVVYVGDVAVVDAIPTLNRVRDSGVALAYVTNNASRTPEVVAQRLSRLGLPVGRDDVATSAQAAAAHLAELLGVRSTPSGSSSAHAVPEPLKVLVVGGEGLRVAVLEEGMVPVSSLADEPVAIVMGFGPEVGWRDLAEATYAVSSGLPFVASNMDLTVPTTRGTAPGNGALVQAVAAASGREPIIVGKPRPTLFVHAQARMGAQRPLVVGDRLDTDIAGANHAGMDSLLVMTGVTDALTLAQATPIHRPTHLGLTLRDLLDPPARTPLVTAGEHVSGCVGASQDGDTVTWRIVPPKASPGGQDGPDSAVLLDALRAVTAAAWSSETTVQRIQPPLVVDPRDPRGSG